MFLGKKDSKPLVVSPSPNRTITVGHGSKRPNPLLAELSRLMWFLCATLMVLSLLTYSPQDPSWSTWSSKPYFHNWIGRSGSILSDLLYQSFGLAAFSIAAVFFLFAFTKTRFQEEMGESRFSFLNPFLFLFSISCLFQTIYPKTWLPWKLPNSGGLFGKLISDLLEYLTGHLGAVLLSVSFTVASSILLFRWKIVSYLVLWTKAFAAYSKESWPSIIEWGVKKFQSMLTYFRKEKTPPIAIPTAIHTTDAPLLPVAKFEAAQETNEAYSTAIQPELVGMEQTCGPQVHYGPSDEDVEVLKAFAPVKGDQTKPAPAKKLFRKPNTPFSLPQLAILSGKAESKIKSVDKNWYVEKAKILVEKLKDFGVEGEVTHISPGPVITVYEFKPASGVKIKDIANLSDDLTLALSVLSVRIVAPIPGKPVVGIEIPSPHRETVFFKDLIQETPFFDGGIRIPIALGRLASGEPLTADLAAMPHLLVAGSTGTGKSVFINTLIASLLYRFNPDQLRLILVDPKMVELSLYEGIPHLLLPVVVDSKKAALALRWAVDEMERRYTLMHQFGVRHIDGYNERYVEMKKRGELGEEYAQLPYIVVVIDEYADLMSVVPKDVELSIARLAQKARASGIHLVLATQRPSTDVVTGTIKANFPSRISFRVASAVDSKTILDRTGADRLLGHGDMLFHSAGFATLKRMQGSFIADADIARVVDYLKSQGQPEYDEKIMQSLEEPQEDGTFALEGGDGKDEGQLYDKAVRIVTERGEASISLVQRHLSIGYNRAAMLIEQMEKEGIVSPSTGTSKRRTVLVNSI